MEPSWNLASGPPRTTPEPIWAETPKLSAVGGKKNAGGRQKAFPCWCDKEGMTFRVLGLNPGIGPLKGNQCGWFIRGHSISFPAENQQVFAAPTAHTNSCVVGGYSSSSPGKCKTCSVCTFKSTPQDLFGGPGTIKSQETKSKWTCPIQFSESQGKSLPCLQGLKLRSRSEGPPQNRPPPPNIQ